MKNWFEVSVRYEKIFENGTQKKVTEKILVDALSYTECEARSIEEITPYISGEFTVSDIKRANFSEIFQSEDDSADRYFKCKLFFITLDEKSGAEKKTSTTVLVQAADLRDAVKKLDEGMKGTMADYTIASVAETQIMDIYPYESEKDVKPEFPDEDNDNDEIRKVIAALPNGKISQIQIHGKSYHIDKTTQTTKVIPIDEENKTQEQERQADNY